MSTGFPASRIRSNGWVAANLYWGPVLPAVPKMRVDIFFDLPPRFPHLENMIHSLLSAVRADFHCLVMHSYERSAAAGTSTVPPDLPFSSVEWESYTAIILWLRRSSQDQANFVLPCDRGSRFFDSSATV